MPDNRLEIERIQGILNSGIKTTTVGGDVTVFDFDYLERRVAELKEEDTSGNYSAAASKPTKAFDLGAMF